MFLDVYGDEFSRAWKSIDPAAFERAAAVLLNAYTSGARVFTCGNGGSASIANHFQCDHTKGIQSDTSLSPKVTSLSANIEVLTAIANDVGYQEVFSHQLQVQSEAGDVLVVVSSAGWSRNIVNALVRARAMDVRTIALTGFTGGEVRQKASVSVHVDSGNYGVVEDVHQGIMHALAQFIRQSESQ